MKLIFDRSTTIPNGPPHTEAVTNWPDLTSLVATATRLARFLKES